MAHAKQSPKAKAEAFPTTERGRLHKTMVLDHIITMKRNTEKRNESLMNEKKKQNEETFIKYLIDKK